MALVHFASQWWIAAALLAALLIANEAGYRIGLRQRAHVAADAKSEIGTIQAGMLGVLGLLLGFTFSMAVERFDARKQLILDEANAIGTTELRAQLLPEPAASKARARLRAYLDARLAFYEASSDPEGARRADDAAPVLETQLWAVTAEVAAADPRAFPASLFAQALNQVFDLRNAQAEWLENRVPALVLYLNLLFTTVALSSVGYGSGLAGRRNTFATLSLAILVSALVVVILDLDEPRRGMIEVSPRALVELRESLGP